jgi:hypothetical protein
MKQRDACRQKAQTYRGQAPVKWCAVCGREISWRRKWRKDWDNVTYCSDQCRASGLTVRDDEIEKAILKLLQARPHGATICPSEVVRVLQPRESDGSWQVLMKAIRRAARRLAVRRQVAWLQGGRPVDPSKARGPVRLKLTRSTGDLHDRAEVV